MSIETWKSIADWGTIIFIALTVVSGSAALILGDRINEKQSEQLRKFNEEITAAKSELSKQQKETAEAQLALRKYIEDVNLSRGPRMIIDHNAFVAALRGKPKAKVEILFAPNDEEAFELAGMIRRWLGPGDKGDGAGWEVAEPRPIPPVGGDPRISPDAPPAIRYGAMGGLAIISKHLPNLLDKDFKDSSYGALMDAFFTARLVASGESVHTLPEGLFIIVIGQKR